MAVFWLDTIGNMIHSIFPNSRKLHQIIISLQCFIGLGAKTQTQVWMAGSPIDCRFARLAVHIDFPTYRNTRLFQRPSSSDLNLILSFKNKMKRKSGVSFGIEIKFDLFTKFSMRKSRKKKAEIAEWVNNDSEISSLWNEITQP